jgi:LPXTG-motif cell wall-anchored protein
MSYLKVSAAFTFLAVSSALAVTGAPTTSSSPDVAGTGRGDGGLAQYWWMVLIVLIAAAAFWYFARRKNRSL